MQNETYDRIGVSPLYRELTQKRNRFSLVLSAVMLTVYYIYVLFASMTPAEFATPIAEGSKWPIGLIIGWCIQAFAFVMTGIYVYRANSDFDAMTRKLISEAQR